MSLSNPLRNLFLLSIMLVVTFELDVTTSAPVRTEQQKGSCYSMCDSRYSVAKTDSWSACHHGCRLLALLSQMADRKSRKQVKRSCLSACTEAYNATTQEKACNTGCTDQIRIKRRKTSEDRTVSTSESRTTAPAPTPESRSQSSPSIRYLWAKSVIDEQDVDSSLTSEEKTHIPAFLKSFKNNPFRALSSIWSSSFLPQAIKITKSTVTYVTDDADPSLVVASDTETQTQDEVSTAEVVQPQVADVPTVQVKETEDVSTMGTTGDMIRIYTLSNLSKRLPESLWAHGASKMGSLDIPLLMVMMMLLVALLILFRALMADRSYTALSTSDPMTRKEEEAAGLLGSEDEDEDRELERRLVASGLLPPSYEEAENDRPAIGRSIRPLLVSLDFPEPKHATC